MNCSRRTAIASMLAAHAGFGRAQRRPLQVVASFSILADLLRNMGGHGALIHGLFLVLTVANLVAGFQALGTLMAVGLMMLPATAARFWAAQVWSLALAAMLIAMLSGLVGLLLSYHLQWPSGPAIVLVAGAIYLLSLAFGPREGLVWRVLHRHSHKAA